MDAEIKDSTRLMNHRALMTMFKVVARKRPGGTYGGAAETIWPPPFVRLASCCDIWARMMGVASVGSSWRNAYARILKAVRTAEKRPACKI